MPTDIVGRVHDIVASGVRPENAGGPHVTVEAPDALPPLPAAVEVAAYRVAQEAVANCRQHAGASTCRVALAAVNQELRLEIQDDGRGLPPAVEAGIGLTSMRERAAELGGECRIDSSPGRGVSVSAVFPLPEGNQP